MFANGHFGENHGLAHETNTSHLITHAIAQKKHKQNKQEKEKIASTIVALHSSYIPYSFK